ncbi:DUF3037 domain-containing protein [Larkinella terrae]|uniref:DUF3037 domain-containing protein n=1 Tax=Larkinella terrae TaxID=2025311 RepID=A0A7K0EFW1_9BACT|nr:DUF3037 domain-containing protein [Larkinella terrae]MRS60717.1 DUF3037 domain-containing protein [Larkinella terrae]
MNSVFHYSVLQYHHSQALGEVLNIGVLLWFPEQRQAVFRYPSRLSRIRKLYPKFPEKTIRSYFRGISIRANQLNKQPEIFANYKQHPRQLIDNEILIRDSSALQFGEVKTGVVYTSDLSKIADEFYRLYLAFYDEEDPNRGRHDDAYLLTSFKKNLRQRLLGRISRETLEQSITVKPGSTDLSYQFPFAWQNGTYNLVKPVSFDLKLEQSIHEKATLNFGQFTLLQPYADERNARFDLLVARPKNRSLYKSYDQAIELIDQQPRVKIVEESELSDYTEKTAQALNNPN